MSYRVLPHPSDVDVQTVQQMVAWCKANGIDAMKIPAPAGDSGFGLQIHGDTIWFREYAFNEGRVILDDARGGPVVNEWGERPLLAPPEAFGITTVKVRA